MSVDELVAQMEKAWGFTAGKTAVAVHILENMMKTQNCTKFLSFTGNLVATGTRGVFKELVKRRLVDVIITTCGTLDHDLARCWKDYYRGSFIMNDAKLHEEGINRLGNVLVPNDSYGIIIEQKIQALLQELYKEGKRELSASQLTREIGLRMPTSFGACGRLLRPRPTLRGQGTSVPPVPCDRLPKSWRLRKSAVEEGPHPMPRRSVPWWPANTTTCTIADTTASRSFWPTMSSSCAAYNST